MNTVSARSQDSVNWRIYHAHGIAQHYRHELLDRAETMVLLRHQDAFAGRNVLDLGVGTGRTTQFLKPLARHYVGIDYSQEMVDNVRARQPGAEVHLLDMRDLSRWNEGTFDFIFGPNNVLDAVSHEDRLRVLTQARRALHTGGLLVFSSHNRNYHRAQHGPQLELSRNPVTQTLHVLRYLKRCVNHLRMASLRRLEADYALLDDLGHDYGALHYYIERHAQRRQLESSGFSLSEAIDHTGRLVGAAEDDSSSPHLMYVAIAI